MILKYFLAFSILFIGLNLKASGQALPPSEHICGKWESTDKRLIVQIYVENNQFLAKVVWFINTNGKPLDYWKDTKNPDPKLRNRKLLGMSILNDLKYDKETNTWEDGMVYDSTHGRTWNASAYIDKKGILQVRGFWHFKFIGRTMEFYRV